MNPPPTSSIDREGLRRIAESYTPNIQEVLQQGGTRLRILRASIPTEVNVSKDQFWLLIEAFKDLKVRVEVPDGFMGHEIILHWDQP